MTRGPLFPESQQAEDESLAVARSLAGAADAFEPLVRAHASRVIRLAYHFLGNWDEARDLAQETFARAYFCLGKYDPGRPFATWLCTIAARLATDRLRRRRVQARAAASLPPPRTRGLDPETDLSLREALARLTPRQRQAVVLCDLHGFSGTEAAEMIGCAASTIRVLRLLARRRLRDALAGAAELDPEVESAAADAIVLEARK